LCAKEHPINDKPPVPDRHRRGEQPGTTRQAGGYPMTHPTSTGTGTKSGLPKLGAGELRAQVLAALTATPTVAYSAGQIARHLGGRSGGAVRGAIHTLESAGLVAEEPGTRHYRVTAAGPTTATAPVTPPAAPVAAPRTSDPIRRPGGTLYHPRELAGKRDVDVLRRLRADNIPVLLYGPPGTGKTSVVEAAFSEVITVGGHGDTAVEDFLGSFVPDPAGGFTFAYGPLVTAMREGRPLFVDDGTLIPPRVLAILYPVMDGRGTLTIPAHHHETVTAAPGFYTVFGHNPGVHGAILTEALASRLSVHIEVTTDFTLARSLGVPSGAVSVARHLNRQLRDGKVDWAPQLRELLAFKRIAAAIGDDAAYANLAAIAPEDDREAVTEAIRTRAHKTVTPLTLGDQC
jgi:nitric oxide reductase NorQ protein